MNFRKTWFGYLNFAVSVIITGALVMALVFLSLFKTNISSASVSSAVSFDNPMFWAFLGISIAAIALIALIVFLVRKLRINILLKKNALNDSRITKTVGGILALAFFVSGLVLRVKFVLSHTFDPAFDVDITNEIFWGNKISASRGDFDVFYCKVMAFLYRFIGIKPGAFIWLNVVLSSLILIVLFFTVSIVFDEVTACVPIAFLCFSSTVYTRIALGSGDYIKYLVVSVLLLIAVKVISLFKDAASFPDFGLALTQISILLFLLVLPVVFSGSLSLSFLFDLTREKILYDLFGNTYLFMGIVIFMLIAQINFLFSDRDRLSPVSLIWMIALFFYMFTANSFFNSAWPGDSLMLILFTVFAGLGLSELLFSEIYEADRDESPVIQTVTVPEPEKKTISRIESAKMLTDEATKVREKENDVPSVNEQPSLTAEPVKLFENPLPLPKPHVKREIEYRFEPDESQMKFDIDIKDGDDFDL